MGKIKKTVLYLMILCLVLGGCGRKNTKMEDVIHSNTAEEKKEESGEEHSQGEQNCEEQRLYVEDKKSCIIQEDESCIYVCGIYKIVKIDKETKESVTLWETTEVSDEQKIYPFWEGCGLLVGDKIYFIEGWEEGTGNGLTDRRALSVIHTDGTGYERVEQSEKLYGSECMILQDGILYVETADKVISYKVYEDGSVFEAAVREERGGRDDFPEGFEETGYYDNGYRMLFAEESMKKFGGVILERRSDLVKWIPETGEMLDLSQFGGRLDAFNSRYFLISSYDEESYLVDTETLEGRWLTDYSVYGIITMDDNYIYLETETYEEGRTQYVYEKISLETAEKSVIFRREENKTTYSWYAHEPMDAVVKDGYLYYVGEIDYKLYLTRRKVDEPSVEECLGDAFYDSGISEVGTMEECHERFEVPGVSVNIDLEWLQVDSRFPGADKINEYLEEDQKRHYDYEKQLMEEFRKPENGATGEAGSEEEEITLRFGCNSEFSEISYFDGQYLSFCQSEAFDEGGAHHRLDQTGYTFDLQTGKRLGLADIIADSEEELTAVVKKHFEEIILANPEDYWEDALEVVEEFIGFEDSLFYLTDDGIRFYFGPYALASFAAGFQEVTIPYEEFEMKILQ